MAPRRIIVLIHLFFLNWAMAEDLKFTTKFPFNLDFSNSTGGKIICKADGNPQPTVEWRFSDGSTVSPIPGLREITNDSSLIFPPFSAQNYRQDVHAVSYRCSATNRFGTLVSKEIKVRGVINQAFDVYVYDVYIIKGNSAVMRCHIPEFLEPYTVVFSWILDSVLSIRSINFDTNSKYILLPSGDLLIKDVDSSNTHSSYQCQVSHRLTKELKTSVTSGRLIITESEGKIPPKMVYSKSIIVVQEGEDVLLPCVANGKPVPKYKWSLQTKAGNYMTIKMNGRINLVSGSLLIENVQGFEEGTYICTATNEVSSANVLIELKVIVIINIKVFQPQVTIDANDKALISCKISGTIQNSVLWLKDGRSLPKDAIEIVSNETLQINKMSSTLTGIYQCLAKNDLDSVFGAVIVKLGETLPNITKGFKEELLQPGDTAILQCSARGSPLPQIHWTLDSTNFHLTDRVRVNAKSNGKDEVTSALSIVNITVKEGGLYRCVANSNAGKTAHVAKINVVGELGIRSNVTIQATEDGYLEIDCPVYGYPITEIKWQKNGQTLPVHIRQAIYPNGTLVVSHVERRIDSGLYNCIVKGQNQQLLQGEVEVVIMVAPKITPFSFRNDPVFDGSLARISCVVYRGDLPLTLEWNKDGIPISRLPNITERVLDDYSSILTISNIQTIHAGNYTCIAKNAAATVKYSAQLLVKTPPEWIVEPQDITTQSGQYVNLNCQADGFPKPTVVWKKVLANNLIHQSELIENDNHVTVFSNGSLTIRNIMNIHSGQYVCLATNNVRIPLSKVITIKVQAAPEFLSNISYITTKKGDKLKITCEAKGDLPILYQWFVDNQTISNDSNSQRFQVNTVDDNVAQRSSSILEVQSVGQKDSNYFTCVARNAIGSSEITFKVIVQEPPGIPTITAKNLINQSIELEWNVTFNGHSNITHYILQYKKDFEHWNGKVKNLTLPGTQTRTIVPLLKAATLYNFRLMAINAVGNGNFSQEITVTTKDNFPEGVPQNIEIESTDPNTLRITWNPPKKSLWNGAIRGYNIGYKIHQSSDDYIFMNLEVPEDYTDELIYQLLDLNMYTQYDIVVSAYNSIGNGPNSKPVLAMTSEDVPSSPPKAIRCSPLSSKSIYVLWEQPESDSINGILRGYKVLYKPVDEWYDAMMQSSMVQLPKITLQKLRVNTNYTIQILAFTKVGDGVKSDPVYCKTHEDVPEPPETIKVLPSSPHSVIVAWKPPQRANGALTKYNVYYKSIEDGLQIDTEFQKTEAFQRDALVHQSRMDNNFFEVKGLKKNKKYAFWVTAMSAIGESFASIIVAQTVADAIVSAKAASFDKTIKTPWRSDVIMQCVAVGVPPPSRRWTLENGRLLKERKGLKIHSDGTVVITKVDQTDAGNYTCSIYNEYGRDEVQYMLLVQVPPSAPMLDVISKSRTSFTIRWSPGISGGDNIKGYLLQYKPENGVWNTKEIKPDQSMYTINNLACGTTYHVYMEAFNNIGTGEPCETISVTTDGANFIPPTKDKLLREGSTFVTIHLEAWPLNACPVKRFTAEYRPLSKRNWVVAASNIRPTQKKLTISGLVPATWYMLRLTAEGSGDPIITEHKFATHTTSGGTVLPEVFEETVTPVQIFYLDPVIFIPATALLIVVIIASVIVCIYFRKQNGSAISPRNSIDFASTTWKKQSHTLPRGKFSRPEMKFAASDRTIAEPSPYATTRIHDFYTPGKPRKNITANGFYVLPPTAAIREEILQRYPNRYSHTTPGNTSTFPPTRISDARDNYESDYDAPPIAHMFRNPEPRNFRTMTNPK